VFFECAPAENEKNALAKFDPLADQHEYFAQPSIDGITDRCRVSSIGGESAMLIA